MKVYKNGCPICSGACRFMGTSDDGKEVEVGCANCTVYRISLQAVKIFLMNPDNTKNLYSLLARRSPAGHMIVIGTSFSEITYEYVSIECLKSENFHDW